MPVPGTNRLRAARAPSSDETQSANRDLQGFAAWAKTVQGGVG